MEYDLIIVGSGSVGSAAGYYSSRAGLKVLMIDSGHPPHDNGSHHGDTRLIRHAYGEGKKYVPLVLRAQQLWDELQALSGEKIFEKTGVINLGPPDSKFLANIVESGRAWNIPVEKYGVQETKRRWPQITLPDNFIGVFEPNSGVLRSEVAVKTYIGLAKNHGCTQVFNCPVTAISSDDKRVRVETQRGTFVGKKLLVSAGTWVGKLVPNLPVTPVRKVVAWFAVYSKDYGKEKFPGFIAELENGDMFYGFPAENNELKVGMHNGGQKIKEPTERKPFGAVSTDTKEVLPFFQTYLPGVGSCVRGASCTYDMSPDEGFIIEKLNSRTLIITGLSGHGFKFSSVLGEIAANFAQDNDSEFDLNPFSLYRFNQKSKM